VAAVPLCPERLGPAVPVSGSVGQNSPSGAGRDIGVATLAAVLVHNPASSTTASV
jgi:hypothetical protein